MKITILGSGTSSGIPNIAFGFGDCDPHNPKNIRSRSSIFIENGKDKILIDTTPDVRSQLLREKITDISAVLFTHAHADHCHGIDDLRPLMLKKGKALPTFLTQDTFDKLYKKFPYIFPHPKPNQNIYPPILNANIILYQKKFTIGNTDIIAFAQQHGKEISSGFRIADFAYSTDVSHLNQLAFATLNGITCWIVDALQISPHGSHSNLANTLSWIKRVKPKNAFLTHLSIFMDHDNITAQCPPHVAPLYDGQVLEL
ncbi:MAG: MBL fold metallo-hydrolase [Alphaproteobacteria bacterium]